MKTSLAIALLMIAGKGEKGERKKGRNSMAGNDCAYNQTQL